VCRDPDLIIMIQESARFLKWTGFVMLCLASTLSGTEPSLQTTVCAKGNSICIPQNYSKFDLPNETQTTVSVGIDIKDIPKIDDKEFSVTLNAFFLVRWTDTRLVIDQQRIDEILGPEVGAEAEWIPVDVSFIKEFWLPDAEILNLKEFKTLDVLSKLEGLWLNRDFEIMYAVATRITFICPMTFNSFPLDVQVCLFQVGSFNYDNQKMVFTDEFIADESQIRSVLDYAVEIRKLPESKQNYVAITGNYSVAGFELTLRRKVSHYIITCYLPSGMFVIVSWISFLIPPDIVPGRMTLLITVFLVLVNIFNTITTNIPKAEGLTAIEAFVIVCVLFVFGALIEYAGILLQLKVRVSMKKCPVVKKIPSRRASHEDQVPLTNIQIPPSNGTKTLQLDCDHQTVSTRNQEVDVRRKKSKKSKNLTDEKLAVARLDLMFLLLFPLFFFIFNLIYWMSFLYVIPDW